MPQMKKYAMLVLAVMTVGAVALLAQGQSRPGEMSQARVWVQNTASEPVPVVVERVAGVTQVRMTGVDPDLVVPVRAVRQFLEYRTFVLDPRIDSMAGLQ